MENFWGIFSKICTFTIWFLVSGKASVPNFGNLIAKEKKMTNLKLISFSFWFWFFTDLIFWKLIYKLCFFGGIQYNNTVKVPKIQSNPISRLYAFCWNIHEWCDNSELIGKLLAIGHKVPRFSIFLSRIFAPNFDLILYEKSMKLIEVIAFCKSMHFLKVFNFSCQKKISIQESPTRFFMWVLSTKSKTNFYRFINSVQINWWCNPRW